MADIIIETPRLRLRTWDAGDVDAFHAHLNSPAVMRWLGGVQPREAYQASYERTVTSHARYGHCFWVVERIADGALLGFCGLKRVDAEGTDLTGSFEIGWRLREDCWGQGYAREAAEAALGRAFGVHDAPFVVAFTVEGNAASWGLMKRLGMERHPELDFVDPRFGPDLNPTIVYRIGREQWKV
ncbi:GNAT family N-acetyltransferase [Sphingomonas sp. C3-2]|uniref:GNAT family N-acetyltransferase n=1 Tax=Sphingomonas sp. C3-2 TaxID=3062169 RepID=UPI00294B640D|nr:GNAT family N-acetyltransferase [Sphingomonas sp. C3-2]WOK36570.1 GNAT family N-acetyltransferase [Sphingomonas sp. C3-2]